MLPGQLLTRDLLAGYVSPSHKKRKSRPSHWVAQQATVLTLRGARGNFWVSYKISELSYKEDSPGEYLNNHVATWTRHT